MGHSCKEQERLCAQQNGESLDRWDVRSSRVLRKVRMLLGSNRHSDSPILYSGPTHDLALLPLNLRGYYFISQGALAYP